MLRKLFVCLFVDVYPFLISIRPPYLPTTSSFVPRTIALLLRHGGVCWCCRVLLWNGKYTKNSVFIICSAIDVLLGSTMLLPVGGVVGGCSLV